MPHHARYYEPRNERGRLVLLVLIPGVPIYKICSSDFYNREKRSRRIVVQVYDRGLKNCLIVVPLFLLDGGSVKNDLRLIQRGGSRLWLSLKESRKHS